MNRPERRIAVERKSTMSTIMLPKSVHATDAVLTGVRRFMAEQGSALCQASLLLGGSKAEHRCFGLLSSLAEDRALRRHHVLVLIALHRLLTLQNVGDPESTETALFAKIDPNDPRVHDLCLLADRLFDLLVEIAAAQEQQTTPPELLEHIAA